MLANVGIGIFKRRSSSAQDNARAPPPPPPSPPRRRPMPYETPIPGGRCAFLELPEEVLQLVFNELDLPSLTRCYRLCKAVNGYMTESAATSLHHTLMANSFRLNPLATWARPDMPNQMPQTSASMLSTLRERLTRLRNIAPASTSSTTLREPEGSLYEYLEGVLLRSRHSNPAVTRPRYTNEMAVYDMRRGGDWEDVVDDDGESAGGGPKAGTSPPQEDEEEVVDEDEINESRRTFASKFTIMEMAVDPGQDLLVLVELRTRPRQGRRAVHTMHFHLLSLETFGPHPLAREEVIDWPFEMSSREISLDFQICDDAFFVLSKKRVGGEAIRDALIGWQWTTGRLTAVLPAPSGTVTFQSFVLLSPSSLVVPTVIAHLNPDLEVLDEIQNPTDLSFTYHLHLFAFPPFSGDAYTTDPPPPVPLTHVATIDLPPFFTNLLDNEPPAHIGARTDPPPRAHFPTHPAIAPPPFQPDPESGIAIFEFYFQTMRHEPDPHYVLFMHKTALLRYMPAPTSPLLTKEFSRPAPVIPWDKIAPDTRLFGPELDAPDWVCYVYQNRYVTTEDIVDIERMDEEGNVPITGTMLLVYDFDPLHVRQEKLARLHRLQDANPGKEITDEMLEGEVDGIELHLAEEVHEAVAPLTREITTGANVPYLLARRPMPNGSVPLIDSERILTVDERNIREDSNGNRTYGEIRVMQF